MAKNILSHADAVSLVNYDPYTGVFSLRIDTKRYPAGKVLGRALPTGYLMACVAGHECYLHRLAWFITYGYWPPHEVDHINGDPGDNRLSNLRLATRQENMQNLHGARSSNKSSSFIGVSWMTTKGRWRAEIRIGGRKKHLGLFENEVDAADAYLRAKRANHPRCTI